MMKSKNELNAIESLDFYRRKLLACFITIGEKPVDKIEQEAMYTIKVDIVDE